MYLGQVAQPNNEPMDDTAIFRLIYQTAQKHFPEKTAEFDAFIQEQATKYGIEYAKLKTEKQVGTVLRSPFFWLGLGLFTSWLVNR